MCYLVPVILLRKVLSLSKNSFSWSLIYILTLIAVLYKLFNFNFYTMSKKSIQNFLLSCTPSRMWSHCLYPRIIALSYMNVVSCNLMLIFRRNNKPFFLVHQMFIKHKKGFQAFQKKHFSPISLIITGRWELPLRNFLIALMLMWLVISFFDLQNNRF